MNDISSSNDADAAGIESAGNRPPVVGPQAIAVRRCGNRDGGGMALNWGWLTAIGLATVLVSFAPCAVIV